MNWIYEVYDHRENRVNMDSSIPDIFFHSKDELIRYINTMCIVNKGKGFTLRDKYPYKRIYYKENVFGTKLLPRKSENIISKDQLPYFYDIKWACWRNYLTDIKTMPVGIGVSTSEEAVGAISHTRKYSEYRIQYMIVNYVISSEYAESIYKVCEKYASHQAILDDMSKLIHFRPLGKDSVYSNLIITSTGISNYMSTRRNFSEYGMKPLPDVAHCFAFTKALSEYIVRKQASDITMYESHIAVDFFKERIDLTLTGKRIMEGLKDW